MQATWMWKPRAEVQTTSNRAIRSLVVIAIAMVPTIALGFTQLATGVTPMGHEWLTRLAALELLGDDPLNPSRENDPRRHWTNGLAKNTELSSDAAQREVARIKEHTVDDQRYKSAFQPIHDAIIGQRWVDLGGFNVATSMLGKHDPFDAVAQQPAEVQYDHFMRRYDDSGVNGGVNAAQRSRERFIKYFVAAATADPGVLRVWDGGITQARVDVDRNYFLFGRAVHLFQDSFTSEHTVRRVADNHETLIQVKSYLCATGAEQHSHSKLDLINYKSGDVIWTPGTQLDVGWSGYKAANMKDLALVATEASKDLWAAFIRAMGAPRDQRRDVAEAEAALVARTWLTLDARTAESWYDTEAHRDDTYVLATNQVGKGHTQVQCMVDLGVKSGSQPEKVEELESAQRICIYNLKAEEGYPEFDASLHIPLYWAWTSATSWNTPPDDWKIPDQAPGDTGRRVRIKNLANDQYMTAPGGAAKNELIYCKPGVPLEFVMFGEKNKCYFRFVDASLFLSYRSLTGAVKLFDSSKDATYVLEEQQTGAYAIKNIRHAQYLWLDGQEPYITPTGDPANWNAHWVIEGLPGPPVQTRQVRIRSLGNLHYMIAPGGVGKDELIYCRPGAALAFTMVGDLNKCVFVKDGLFLSYRNITGAVKLYDSGGDASYSLALQDNGSYTIKNRDYEQYMWISGDEPYITQSGDPKMITAKWIIDGLPGQVEIREVTIRSYLNNEYMNAPGGVRNNEMIYCKPGGQLRFTMVGPEAECYFHIVDPGLFLSYRDLTGAVKLYDSGSDATYACTRLYDGAYTIRNLRHNQYLWLDGQEPYVTRTGSVDNLNARWIIDGLGPGVTRRKVRIKSAKNGKYMMAPGGVRNNELLYCKNGTALHFVVVGSDDGCYFVTEGLFLNYRDLTGAVKLYDSSTDASYALVKQGNGNYAIKSTRLGQYVWLSGDEPYLTRKGDPSKIHSQWVFEEVE